MPEDDSQVVQAVFFSHLAMHWLLLLAYVFHTIG